jgi:hypothetical protein
MNGQLYVVPELSRTFQQWTNKKANLISDKIFPEVIVENMERFSVWSGGNEHLIIPSNTLRFGRAKANESTFSQSLAEKGPLNEHALSSFITERQYMLSSKNVPGLEDRVVESLASQMELVDEKALADFMSDTANITHYTAITAPEDKWTADTSDPFDVIKDLVLQQNQYSPADANVAWISKNAWLNIIEHPAFLDRIKWSKLGKMTQEDFLRLFSEYGIERLEIASGKINTANEGQTKNMANIWGNHFWIGYITDQPGQEEINGGYKFRMKGIREVTREQKSNPNGAEIVTRDFYDHICLSTDVYAMVKDIV